MADVSKTVEIIFGGKDQVSETVRSVKGGLEELSGSVTNLAQPFAAIADGVIKADTALAALAVGGLALSIREAGKFQASFNEILTVSSATGDGVKKFEGEIEAYASKSVKSIDDINKSIYAAISAGVDYKDSLALLSTSEKLSVAGKADLEKTTLLLVSSLNAYGAGMDQAQKYSDVFFQTVKLGQTTIPELASSLSGVTSIAATANVPIEAVGAALAALTVSGVPTSEAVTGVKAAIEGIISPTDSAKEAALKMGVSFNETALKTKGFDGVLREVYKAAGGSTEKVNELFTSSEALKVAMVLGADKAGKYKESIAAMGSAAGSTEEAFKIMEKNLNLMMTNLGNNVELVLKDVGKRVLPEFSGDVKGLAEVFKGIKISLDQGAFDPLFAVLKDAMINVETLLNGIAKAFPEAMKQVDFSGLVAALKELGAGFGNLFDNFDPTDPEKLAKALQFVTNSITSLITVTKGMVDAFKPFVDGIVNSIEGFNKLDTKAKESGGNILGSAKMIVDAGALILGAMVTIGQSADTLKSAFEVIIGGIGFLWSSAKSSFDAIILSMIGLTQTLWSAIDALSFGQFTKEIEANQKGLNKWKVEYENAFIKNATEARNNLVMWGKGVDDLAGVVREGEKDVKVLGETVQNLPSEADIEFKAETDSALRDMLEFAESLEEIPKSKSVSVGATTDDTSLAAAKSKLGQWIPDKHGVLVLTNYDPNAFAATKKAIDDNIPKEKQIEVQAKVDIAKIESDTKKIEGYFKYKAEVDVAEITAAADKAKYAFESVNTTLTTTSSLIGGLFSDWLKADTFEKSTIEGWVSEQLAYQKSALLLQEKLIKAQIKEAEARANMMNNGKALIQVTGEGLAPEIEAFMFKILEKIQLRVTEDAAQFLVGIK